MQNGLVNEETEIDVPQQTVQTLRAVHPPMVSLVGWITTDVVSGLKMAKEVQEVQRAAVMWSWKYDFVNDLSEFYPLRALDPTALIDPPFQTQHHCRHVRLVLPRMKMMSSIRHRFGSA